MSCQNFVSPPPPRPPPHTPKNCPSKVRQFFFILRTEKNTHHCDKWRTNPPTNVIVVQFPKKDRQSKSFRWQIIPPCRFPPDISHRDPLKYSPTDMPCSEKNARKSTRRCASKTCKTCKTVETHVHHYHVHHRQLIIMMLIIINS